MKSFIAPKLFGVACLSLSFSLCACLHRSPEHLASSGGDKIPPSIREVYFNAAEVKPYAERVRLIGDEMYPKIVALLSDERSRLPQQVDVRFKKRFWMFRGDHAGNETLGRVMGKGKTVYISLEVLEKMEANSASDEKEPSRTFEKAFIHELAHVAQYYPASTYRKHRYWAEGLADYVRYKLGDTNGWRRPECSAEFTHYTSGYTCAGAFLLYLDGGFGESFIRQMNSALRTILFPTTSFFKIPAVP